MNGVERLRRERGEERVSFNDVADHLEDFAARDPAASPTIDGLAAFLAGVEGVAHEHEEGPPTIDPSEPI